MHRQNESVAATAAPETARELDHQIARVRDSGCINAIVEKLPVPVAVVNRDNRIVAVNDWARTGTSSMPAVAAGAWFGALVDCIHSTGDGPGCGHSPVCATCGALDAVRGASSGRETALDASITRPGGRGHLDLKVWAAPETIEGIPFTLMMVTDIGERKRREFLEHLLFAKLASVTGVIGDTVAAIDGLAPSDSGGFNDVLTDTLRLLKDELGTYLMVLSAEKGRIRIETKPVDVARAATAVAGFFRNQEEATNRFLVVDVPDAPVFCPGDPSLLRFVTGCMIQNALEASAPGGVVTVSVTDEGESVRIAVHNVGEMAPDVRLRVFQRSFSTKGDGRGMGTWAMKILGEDILGGTVGFDSSREDGTVFFARFPRAAV